MASNASKPTLGVVVAAFLAMAATYFTMSSAEFVLTVAQVDLGFTVDDANALTFAPSAASLVIVFLAGSLADRWGPRPMLLGASALFTIGAVLVCVAPSLTWIIVGRMLDGIGGVTMTIVGLSVINTTFSEPTQRARIFAAYAAVTPAVFILSPPLAPSSWSHSGGALPSSRGSSSALSPLSPLCGLSPVATRAKPESWPRRCVRDSCSRASPWVR